MIKVGDKVKLKAGIELQFGNFVVENLFDVIRLEKDMATITNNYQTIVIDIENLELLESKKDEAEKQNKTIFFTGKEIELDNKIGATAKIYHSFDDKKKKYICIEICTNTIIETSFECLEDVNVFLKSLGFKEVLQSKFDLVNFLKDNLEPKEFIYRDKNIFLYYDHQKKEVNWDYIKEDEMMGTVHFKEMEREKLISIINEMNIQNIKSEQLKEAYRELGWL